MATAKRLLEVIWQASQPGFGSVGAQSQLIPEKKKLKCSDCGKPIKSGEEVEIPTGRGSDPYKTFCKKCAEEK